MITVVSTPPLVAITGNPVRWKLSTNNVVETAGALATMTITFPDRGFEYFGDAFTLSWGVLSIRFACKAVPDNSGNEISDGSNAADLNGWVALIATEVQGNYYINRDFVVTSNENTLILTARTAGSVYSLALSHEFSDHYPTEVHTSGSDETRRSFFKIGLQVLLKLEGTWTQIGEDILPVDDSLQASFDIHRLFADRVHPEFKFPEASDQIIIERSFHCMEYKVRYFEQFGNPISPQKPTESCSFYILAAGISHLQEAIYNRQGFSLWDKLGYNQYFLTWSPKDKLIDRWTTEKLYYLVRTSLSSICLKVEVHYNDETPTETLTKATVFSPVDKAVYEVGCSLNVLQLPGYDADTIDYYKVWIEDGSSNRISEIRTFRIDYSYHEDIRQFLFVNSLGGYDTLRTTGDVEDFLELERTTVQKILGPDFTERHHAIAQNIVREAQTYSANTGWLTREQVSWIRDFFLSKQVYQLIAGKLVPVLITSTQGKLRRDREDIFSIDFEYRRAFANEYYTKELIPVEFNNDFNDDFANE